MKKQPIKRAAMTKKKTVSNSSNENSNAWMIGGAALLLIGLGTAYYFYRKRKKTQEREIVLPEIVPANTTTIKNTIRPVNTYTPNRPTRTRFKCSSSSYPLQYGTCNNDVKVLQTYLKAKGAYLGRSGAKRDGVDGQFGNLTLSAAKKYLGKSSFSKSDMLAYRTTPKMIKL